MRLLAITPIFPNRLEPLYGPYNRQQFKALEAEGVEVRVLCAVPHLPGASLLGAPKRAATLAALGEGDEIDGLSTRYLRRLYVPGVGAPVAVPLYLASLAPHRDLLKWADVILGTWAYPDGCAAVLAARALGKPCAVKVHGSDVNVIAKRPAVRAIMRRVLPRAGALVTVSGAMGDELAAIGVPRSRIHLVANGIDAALFGAAPARADARRELGLDAPGPVLLFIGRIEPQKGIAELLTAFERVHRERPDVTLVLAGDGVWRERVERARAKYHGRLHVAGARPFAEIPTWLAACDLVVLPSHNEGTPNVLLEGLACGRPAVATRVGGIPDVLADPRSGIVVEPRDANALAEGLLAALARDWSDADARACGPWSWQESAAHLAAVLRSLHAAGGSGA
ncbi:MAG: glycosyltransferase family 4 protein [Labilithrix sp.]|nr:glycosyltransferase family 4 protein [Labilithrix sp.]